MRERIVPMNTFKIEDHNAVALLQRLRDGLTNSNARQRKVVFNGLRDALKGLGLVKAKEPILGLWEGIDQAGQHWFMCEMDDRLPAAPDQLSFVSLALADSLAARASELCESLGTEDVPSVVDFRNSFLNVIEGYSNVTKRGAAGADGQPVVHTQKSEAESKG